MGDKNGDFEGELVPVTRRFNHSIGNSFNVFLICFTRILIRSTSFSFAFQFHSGHDWTSSKNEVIVSLANAAHEASSSCPHQRCTRSTRTSSLYFSQSRIRDSSGRMSLSGVEEVNVSGDVRIASISSINESGRLVESNSSALAGMVAIYSFKGRILGLVVVAHAGDLGRWCC